MQHAVHRKERGQIIPDDYKMAGQKAWGMRFPLISPIHVYRCGGDWFHLASCSTPHPPPHLSPLHAIHVTIHPYNPEPEFSNVYEALESIPRNEFHQPSSLAGWYDNPIPTRFL
jgi:hypothetical protein